MEQLVQKIYIALQTRRFYEWYNNEFELFISDNANEEATKKIKEEIKEIFLV
jgi:hypothetical protein